MRLALMSGFKVYSYSLYEAMLDWSGVPYRLPTSIAFENGVFELPPCGNNTFVYPSPSSQSLKESLKGITSQEDQQSYIVELSQRVTELEISRNRYQRQLDTVEDERALLQKVRLLLVP